MEHVENFLTFSGHNGAIYDLASSNQFIYSAAADKFVARWDLTTGNQDAFAIRFEQTPYAINLFANQQFLAVGLANGDLHIFHLEERKEVKFYQQHKSGIFSIVHSDEMLAVADASGNMSFWDSNSLELIIYLPFDCGKIRKMQFTEGGKFLYFVSQDGFIRKIDTSTFNLIQENFITKDGLTSILIDDNQVVIGAKDARLYSLDFNLNVIRQLPAHNYVIYDLLKLNSQNYLSASRDKSIKLWDNTFSKVIQKVDLKKGGHKHSVNRLVKVDDEIFASASDDGKIKLWRIK